MTIEVRIVGDIGGELVSGTDADGELEGDGVSSEDDGIVVLAGAVVETSLVIGGRVLGEVNGTENY